MNRKLLLFALICVISSACMAKGSEQVYKWTDASGVVHFSDAPPPRDTANVQTMRVSGGDRPREVTADNTENAENSAASKSGDDATQKGVVADAKADRAKNCTTARENLSLLQSHFPVNMTGADGKAQPLDDSARTKQIGDAQALIDIYCK